MYDVNCFLDFNSLNKADCLVEEDERNMHDSGTDMHITNSSKKLPCTT